MREAEGTGGGDGRKRGRLSDSSQSNHKGKKPKKLSSVAMRALAAMESDDGDSESSSSEGEKDARDWQHLGHQEQDRGHVSVSQTILSAAAAPSANSEAGITKTNIAVDDTDNAFPTTEEDEKARENSSGQNYSRKSHDKELNEGADKQNKIAESQHSHNRSTPTANQDVPHTNDKSDIAVGLTTDSDDAEHVTSENHRDASTTDENDFVRPHEVGNDILESFLSTPFDDKAMMTLHKSKEGIARGSDGSKTPRGCVPLPKEYVPIIPQKEFTKRMRETAKRRDSRLNAIGGAANPTETAAMRGEVYSFLLQEGQHLVNPLPPPNYAYATTSQQPQGQFQYPREPSIQQSRQQPPNHQPRPLHTQQMQPANYHGFTQQQNSYYPRSMHSYDLFPQMQHGHRPHNGWQYPQQFPAPAAQFAPVPSIRHAYYKPPFVEAVSAISPPAPAPSVPPVPPVPPIPPRVQGNTVTKYHSAAVQSRTNVSRPNPRVVTASAEVKLTDENRDDVAKLPVAFGYVLDRMHSSILAEKATQKWVKEGIFAAKSEGYEQGKESQKPRRNPTTPPSQPAGPEFPDGWTTKTFVRSGRTPGKTGGTYSYFYSPVTMRSFRSNKGAQIFIKILNEPGINNDEKLAMDAFKRRGHKK